LVCGKFPPGGVACWLAGEWYLGWQPDWVVLAAETVLIILPNLLLPVLALRYGWISPVPAVRPALGWQWTSWRTVLVGMAVFGVYQVLSRAISISLGAGIPYNLPGSDSSVPVQGLVQAASLLMLLSGFVLVTVLGEETMFRGFIQTQVGCRYGAWVGLGLAALLFALRHLPADLFYAQAWSATPRMWLARELDLGIGAVLLGVARLAGRSTYASALTHALIFVANLFG